MQLVQHNHLPNRAHVHLSSSALASLLIAGALFAAACIAATSQNSDVRKPETTQKPNGTKKPKTTQTPGKKGGGPSVKPEDDPGLLSFIERSKKHCDELKQMRSEIGLQFAHSQSTPEQRAQVQQTIAKLDQVITASAELLQRAGPNAKSDKKAIAARLQVAIADGNLLARSAQQQLGIWSPTSEFDQVLGTVVPCTTKLSPCFDRTKMGSTGEQNVAYAGGVRFFGIGGTENASAPVAVHATYTPATIQSAQEIIQRDGAVAGSVPPKGKSHPIRHMSDYVHLPCRMSDSTACADSKKLQCCAESARY
jgi:hypothetical protein